MTNSIYIPKTILERLTDEELEHASARLDLQNKKAIITDMKRPAQRDTAFVKQKDGTYKEMAYADYLLTEGDIDLKEFLKMKGAV
jgi:hypothetical protein